MTSLDLNYGKKSTHAVKWFCLCPLKKICFSYLDWGLLVWSESGRVSCFEAQMEWLDRFLYKARLEVYRFLEGKFYSLTCKFLPLFICRRYTAQWKSKIDRKFTPGFWSLKNSVNTLYLLKTFFCTIWMFVFGFFSKFIWSNKNYLNLTEAFAFSFSSSGWSYFTALESAEIRLLFR